MVCFHVLSDWISIILIGTNFGLMLGVNLIASKNLLQIANFETRVEQWRLLYEVAKTWVIRFTIGFLILVVPGLFSDFSFPKLVVVVLVLAKIPFTTTVMAPVNNQLLDTKVKAEKSAVLIPRWRVLHYVRILSEFLAFALYIWIVLNNAGHNHHHQNKKKAGHDHDHHHHHHHHHGGSEHHNHRH